MPISSLRCLRIALKSWSRREENCLHWSIKEKVRVNNRRKSSYECKDTWWKANYRRCARKGEYSIDVVGALFHESCRRSIPRNPNRLIDLKQSITLSGVGIAQFESAVKGLLVIYQMFEAEVARTGNKLRPWQTRRDSDDLVLHFANRILTSRKDAGE